MNNLHQVKTNEVVQVWPLFMAFQYDSILDAVIHGYHGAIYTDSLNQPTFVMGVFSDIVYLSGNPNDSIINNVLEKLPLYGEVHCSSQWVDVLTNQGVVLKSFTRYEMNHETIELAPIQEIIDQGVKGAIVKRIDYNLYDEIMAASWSKSLCENFESYKAFSTHAFGYVVIVDETIVSGTSSFARFNGGLEIEIVTHEHYRKKGYATLSAAYFIKECLSKSLIPHWDAANQMSKNLAEKLGYTLLRSYQVYEVISK